VNRSVGRTGDDGELDALCDGLGDHGVARVTDCRHTRVAEQHDLSGRGERRDLGGLLLLVVVVHRDQPRAVLDAEAGEQALGGAGVLCADDLGGLEHFSQPRRRVAEVADRSRRELQHRPSIGWCP
jgi:hypothetical protein